MLLILHQGAIGDFMLTLSVVGALREHLGNLRVVAIASAPSARWATRQGLIDACDSPDSIGLHTLFAPETPLDERLAALLRRATTVASFLGGKGEGIHARLVNATTASVVSIDPRPTPATLSEGIHITDQWASDIRVQGLAIGPPPTILIDPRRSGAFTGPGHTADSPSGTAYPLEAGTQELPPPSPGVIIHPGSGGRHKCWPIERFVELADALGRDRASISWMLGPAEREKAADCCAAIAERTKARPDKLIETDNLAEAADRIRAASLFIGNDGGMTHVAAATGIHTLAVYVATDPRVWRPLGNHVICIREGNNNSASGEVYAAARAKLTAPAPPSPGLTPPSP